MLTKSLQTIIWKKWVTRTWEEIIACSERFIQSIQKFGKGYVFCTSALIDSPNITSIKNTEMSIPLLFFRLVRNSLAQLINRKMTKSWRWNNLFIRLQDPNKLSEVEICRALQGVYRKMCVRNFKYKMEISCSFWFAMAIFLLAFYNSVHHPFFLYAFSLINSVGTGFFGLACFTSNAISL